MLVGPMTDRLAAAITTASRLAPVTLPVLEPLEPILPEGGLRPGSSTQIGGVGGASLALALAAKASETSWTALVGLPYIGLRAASELGIDLDHVVVVPENTVDVFAAVIDAFDIVIACPPPPQRKTPRIAARVRERDAVLLVLGRMPDADLTIVGRAQRWYGIGDGHGHLTARTIDVETPGRRAAARPRHTTLWLPDTDGEIRSQTKIARLHA
jgi:hypothetical protein